LEAKRRYYIIRIPHGEMDERFKSPPWKGGTGATLSRVRIPLSPPKVSFKQYHPTSKYLLNTIHTAILLHQVVSEIILQYYGK
jgi:hypothetical protein